MGKEINIKISIIIIAISFIVFLGIGFAAYSNSLTIEPNANVISDESNFNVHFSSASGSDSTAAINPTKSSTSIKANSAVLTGTTISNMGATFTAPGDSITYTFYVRNTGALPAYLNSITYNNVTGKSAFKVCTPISGTNPQTVSNACSGISITTKIGSLSSTSTNSSISGHLLSKGSYEKVTVTVTYSSSVQTNGDFTVEFGTITLNYGSQD